MPSAPKHLRRAHAHFEASCRIADTGELEWAAVALFYSARDLVHAVFDVDPTLNSSLRHPTNHTGRDMHNPGTIFVVARHYHDLDKEYRGLYAVSRGVRYEGQRVSAADFNDHSIDHSQIRRVTTRYLESAERVIPQWLST